MLNIQSSTIQSVLGNYDYYIHLNIFNSLVWSGSYLAIYSITNNLCLLVLQLYKLPYTWIGNTYLYCYTNLF
jgi:hypothetical protein